MMALFIAGTCGMIGSDDVLACFIAGNVFTIDDWFRLETLHDSSQLTIDMLLNLAVFMWFGAVCPWSIFYDGVVPLYRLVFLGILVLLLRRLPVIFALHPFIRQIPSKRLAALVGFFGPMGVSAIFYLFLSLNYLQRLARKLTDEAKHTEIIHLMEVITSVVWFICICSITVHGLAVPFAKLGLFAFDNASAAMKKK